MNFSQLPRMRTSISPDPRLAYITLNISICMRTIQDACRSCERSVSTPVRFTCLKMRLKQRRSTMNFSPLPYMRTSISPDPRLVYIPLNISICMRTFQDACRSCERSVSTPERFTCLKLRLKLRRSTMNFSQLPHMRTSISPDPRLVYIPLNISICMRTFQYACRSCERSVSTPERFTCLKMRLKLRRSTMNFSQLPHMRRSISPDPRLVYIPLNISICMRTLQDTCRSCERSVSTPERFPCLKMRLKLRRSIMNFSPLPYMRTRISPDPRLVYIPLNISICMRTFQDACRSCERSVSTPERFPCLKMRLKLRRSIMNFSPLPYMRTRISPDPRLVYIPLNISICMRTFQDACRSCERSVSTPGRFTCLKMRLKLRRSTMNFSPLPYMRTSISPDPRLVYIPLNISICMTTFQDACRSCERSVSTPERFTSLKMRLKLRRSTMNSFQLPHMRTSLSPDPRLVYIPLNISISMRTFQEASRSCEKSVSTPGRFTCLKMRLKARRCTMNFSQLPHMRTSRSPDPRLVYIPLKISICMTTFQDACRSCERSVCSPERFPCLKMRLKLRRSTMNFSPLPYMRTSISPDPRLVYIPLNISICMRTFQDACRSCERSVSTPQRFTCLKLRLKLRRSTMNFSQLPHMRTCISPDPRLVYIPLNISICMRTFQYACRSCERSVSTPELFTCLKMRLKLRRSTMNFSRLPHMRRSISPDARLVYIPLNISICIRTFQDACRSCERSVSTPERFTCLKLRVKARRSTMNFSQLAHMRPSITPDPRLVYIPLNISICMRTFQDACRSCERSVSNPERFTCLKIRLKLRRSTMNFSQLPRMRTSISPDPRLVYIPLNISICMRTFKDACRSCERSVSTPERFTCLKMRLKLRRSTMNFSRLPHMRRSISPDPRLVYIPLNIPICMRTFQETCRSCERSVSTPERFTCLKMRLKKRRPTMNFSQLPHMRTSISPNPRLVYIPLNISICMRTFQDACRSCESSVSTPDRLTCLKMRLKLRRSTMNFSQLPHMRTSISPDPRLVYIPRNISICMKTFQDVCSSCESSVSTPERFTCLKMRLKARRSTMNFSQFPHMRTSISPDPRLVYIPLNISICMRTFQDACRSCESSVSTSERFTCLKMRLKLRISTMNFSQLPHMRRSISPDPRLVYIPLNISICMRTLQDTCRSCERSVSTPERFPCLKMRLKLRRSIMNFSPLPYMRTRISPDPRLVYIPLNISICMRTFQDACRSCERSVSTPGRFTCLKMRLKLRRSTMNFSQLPRMRTSISPDPRLVYIPLNISICMTTFQDVCRSCESSVSTPERFTPLKMRLKLRRSTMNFSQLQHMRSSISPDPRLVCIPLHISICMRTLQDACRS